MVQEITRHINKYQQIILLWLLVFALAPCTVKETWFSVAGLDYAKPLNSSKTTTPGQQCQYSPLGERKIAIECKIAVASRYCSISARNIYAARVADCISGNPIDFRANSPPIYILYKRMKLGIV